MRIARAHSHPYFLCRRLLVSFFRSLSLSRFRSVHGVSPMSSARAQSVVAYMPLLLLSSLILSLAHRLFPLLSSYPLMIFDYDELTLSKHATCLLYCSNTCALVFAMLIGRLNLEVAQPTPVSIQSFSIFFLLRLTSK